MKQILFVIPDMAIGGVQRSLVTLLQLAPQDMNITVLTFREGGELLERLPSRVYVRVDQRMGKRERFRTVVSGRLSGRRFNWLFHIAKKLYHRAGERLGHVETRGYYDIAVAYADGLATWYVAQSIQAGQKLAFVHTDVSRAGYDAKQERKIYSCFQRIIFGSQAAERSFLTLMPEFEGKTELLPNMVDVVSIACEAEKEFPIEREEGTVTIATVGRLSHEKGVEKIPVLMRRLKDAGQSVRWYVVGDGSEREKLQRSAQNLGVEKNLILTGTLKNPYPYMRCCDIYIQPSEYEGYCIALAEARALCSPIVTCDFSGAREQIEDGVTGFITGMNVEELFPSILTLIMQPQKRIDFRQALRQRRSDQKEEMRLLQWWRNL